RGVRFAVGGELDRGSHLREACKDMTRCKDEERDSSNELPMSRSCPLALTNAAVLIRIVRFDRLPGTREGGHGKETRRYTGRWVGRRDLGQPSALDCDVIV